MNVYEAIMKAAARIELEPDLFEYKTSRVTGCGSPACAIGWIGFCAGETEDEKFGCLDTRCMRLLGVDYWHGFEHRMLALHREWSWNAANCAKALRLYATKYHAPAKPRRTDSDLVSDLITRVMGERIPEDA